MSRGINIVHLIGNLGNDPDVKYTQGGMAIARLSLATTNVRKDKDGNQQESTQWHRVVAFGKSAEILGEYAKKGSQLYVEGSIKYDKYTDKDGAEKYSTDIVCNNFQFIGGKSEAGSPGGSKGPQRQRPQRATDEPRDDMQDDDIPFITNRSRF